MPACQRELKRCRRRVPRPRLDATVRLGHGLAEVSYDDRDEKAAELHGRLENGEDAARLAV
jgi:hypothetical protein